MKDTLTLTEVAHITGKADSTVHDWLSQGLTSRKVGRNRVIEASALIKWLATRELQPGSERERLATAQAVKVELANARSRGELIYVDQVAEVLSALAADLASRMEGLPGRLAGELAGTSNPAVVRTRLRDELHTVRAAFAGATATLADKLGSARG